MMITIIYTYRQFVSCRIKSFGNWDIDETAPEHRAVSPCRTRAAVHTLRRRKWKNERFFIVVTVNIFVRINLSSPRSSEFVNPKATEAPEKLWLTKIVNSILFLIFFSIRMPIRKHGNKIKFFLARFSLFTNVFTSRFICLSEAFSNRDEFFIWSHISPFSFWLSLTRANTHTVRMNCDRE